MQFVNVVVHSVEDMNFRVHLQYEFSKLGLDEYLEKLRHTESEELQVVLTIGWTGCSRVSYRCTTLVRIIYFKNWVCPRSTGSNFRVSR